MNIPVRKIRLTERQFHRGIPFSLGLNEDRHFAITDELGDLHFALDGDTREEALSLAHEAINLYLKECAA